jgi:hypothetical protein
METSRVTCSALPTGTVREIPWEWMSGEWNGRSIPQLVASASANSEEFAKVSQSREEDKARRDKN